MGIELTPEVLKEIQVATYKLGKQSESVARGDAFPACPNCTDILDEVVTILTGKKARH